MIITSLIISIITMLGFSLIATLKGKKASGIYHFAISMLAFCNMALYEAAGFQYSIFFHLAMLGIVIYEFKMIGVSKKI